jgi:hypothetical protein
MDKVILKARELTEDPILMIFLLKEKRKEQPHKLRKKNRSLTN